MKKILLYVGPVRMLEAWLAEQLKLFAGGGEEGRNRAYVAAETQKKSHRKGGRNWK